MPQPRKEQVKNLKTKYAKGPETVSFSGGPIQNISGAAYAQVLSATRTGAVGGAETSAGAFLVGAQGPFTLAFNSSFNIIISGVNAGLPMTVTFLQADFVKLNAGDVMTTARTVAKINDVLAAKGVSVPVASDVDGRLLLRSANSSGYTFGDESFISLTDVTPGLLQVFGFSSSNQASSVGVSAPKRGVITVSADGKGGLVQIRNLDSTPAEPPNTAMVQVAPYKYIPKVLPGRPAYARLRVAPDASLEVTYYRNGPVRPSIVTSAPGSLSPSDFGNLTLGTVIKVTLDFGNGTVVIFNVSIEDVVTVQQVVDAVNAAYQAASLAITNGTEFNRASVPVPVPGPYVFSDPTTRDSFFVAFNGNTPVHINPPAGEYSASSFATYVNNRIGAAGQVAEGEAVALALTPGDPARTVFRSKSFSGASSSVQFLPGNPGGSVPARFLETLDHLGIAPGVYEGTSCASLYGLDEIEFFCPSTLPGASILIEPQPSINPGVAAALWGLPSPSALATVVVGPVRVAVPEVDVILPEMVEFHEEPDDYDTEILEFEDRGDAATIDPTFGVGNVGISALLGLTGKIDPSFIPGVLDALNLNQLNLGGNRIKSAVDQGSPRAVYPYNPSFGAVLLWEGVDVTEPSTGGLMRMYLKEGDVYLTRNAKMNSGGTWDKDVPTSGPTTYSSMFEFRSGKGSFAVHLGVGSFTHSDWKRNVAFNALGLADSPFTNAMLSLGSGANDSADALNPRIDIPTQLSTPTLLFAAKAATGIVIRAYVTNTAAGNSTMLEITVNAQFNGSQWVKDITGQQATRFDFTASGGFQMSTRAAANDALWTGWDAFPVRFDPAGLINYFQYTLKLGFGATNSTSPRISADRYSASTNRRTLLFESPVTEAYTAVPIRIYLDTANTEKGDGFCFTYNARWDQALDKWVQDVPSKRSNSWLMSEGRFWFFSKVSGSGPWSEGFSSWDTYDLFDRLYPGTAYQGLAVKDGTFRVDSPTAAGSNPGPTVGPIANAIYAKSMVKAWGRGTYQTANITIVDGFNFSAIGANAFAWDSFFPTALTTARSVIQTVENGSNSGFAVSGPANAQLALVFTSVRFISYFIDYAGSLYPQSSYAAMCWVVFCAQ